MDPITRTIASAAAGGSAASKTYVDDVFSTYVYLGTKPATQTINNGIDLSGEGGLVWIKQRNGQREHHLFDTERGATKYLNSRLQDQEATNTATLTAFTSTGFSLGDDTGVNHQEDFVSWSFRKAPGFFDVVTYNGVGASGNVSIAHNLGSVPGMILVKCTSHSSTGWLVYHRSLGATKYLPLNGDAGEYDSDGAWHDTEPTSTHFTLGNYPNAGWGGRTYVAYLFAHDVQSFGANGDESIIKCGSYTGSGSSPTTVNLGFEPQWVMIRRTTGGGGDWVIYDNIRGVIDHNQGDMQLVPNGLVAETNENRIDFYSQGFRVENDASPTNHSGQTYVYMAIRRPHKPPTAATEVFAIDNQGTGTMPPQYHSGFPVDWAFTVAFGESQAYRDRESYTRLLHRTMKKINESATESNFSSAGMDYMNGWHDNNSSVSTTYSWMFKRAPGFFDVVCYSGNGSARTIPHNLGAVPSVVLITSRNGTFSWYWQHYALGANTWLQLNNAEGAASNGSLFNSTLPTSSVFSVGSLAGVNGSGYNYVAYLFGDLDGISKAGTYTGTGSNIDVNCGFSSGARFVIIKKKGTSSSDSGDWYVWDSTRGIASGNDPYFLMNTDNADVDNTDYIDPLNAGFTVTSSAPAALNASGGTYLFLAIA